MELAEYRKDLSKNAIPAAVDKNKVIEADSNFAAVARIAADTVADIAADDIVVADIAEECL